MTADEKAIKHFADLDIKITDVNETLARVEARGACELREEESLTFNADQLGVIEERVREVRAVRPQTAQRCDEVLIRINLTIARARRALTLPRVPIDPEAALAELDEALSRMADR
jgi:hypothetical protein